MNTHKQDTLWAQALCRLLQPLGVTLTHAQALELLAQMQGAKNFQAKKAMDAKKVLDTAYAQATALLFKTLGRYAKRGLPVLLRDIHKAYALEQTQGSRAVEAALADIFERENAPVVHSLFEHLRYEELAATHQTLYKELLHSQSDTEAGQELSLVGVHEDWRLGEGTPAEELPEHHLRRYMLECYHRDAALYLDVSPLGADEEQMESLPQLTLTVEINQGLPCVHLGHTVFGDMELTVFSAADGLVLRANTQNGLVSERRLDSGSDVVRVMKELVADGTAADSLVACMPD